MSYTYPEAAKQMEAAREMLNDAHAALMSETMTLERPPAPPKVKAKAKTPAPVADIELPDRSEYEDLCGDLGYEPPEIATSRVLRAFQSKRIPRYDPGEVAVYMASITPDGMYWGWQRFGAVGDGISPFQAPGIAIRMTSDGMPYAVRRDASVYNGSTIVGEYRKPIPIHILRRIKVVRDLFPKDDPKFYVTDYAVPNPDPFVKVVLRNGEEVIFGMWDEPGFGDLKTEV